MASSLPCIPASLGFILLTSNLPFLDSLEGGVLLLLGVSAIEGWGPPAAMLRFARPWAMSPYSEPPFSHLDTEVFNKIGSPEDTGVPEQLCWGSVFTCVHEDVGHAWFL